jgi:ribosomal-protein-alanine N-acetyltransferase
MAAVHADAFDHPWDTTAFTELMTGPGVFGFLAGEPPVMGLILCRVAADELEVLTVGVAPAARRQGLARALVAAAMAAGRQAGAETAFLEVADDNAAAAALYAGLGFRRAGLRRSYYDRGQRERADAIVMRLDLKGA